MPKVKPLLKWVGGKTQIIQNVLDRFPTTINNYHEPFLGGGSVLLALLESVERGDIVVTGAVWASDLNISLINFYQQIQTNVAEFIGKSIKLKTEFLALSEEDRKFFYYTIREKYRAETETTLDSAVMFLFLNKTCFRGLYRVGPNGFNVPYGNYKQPTIFVEERLRQVSNLIQNVVFTAHSFEHSLAEQMISENDFIYMDPPYAPETSSSFVGYTSSGFPLTLHQKLFAKCRALKKAGILMSNSYVPLVKDSFTSPEFVISIVSCRRRINSKKPASRTEEVLIQRGASESTQEQLDGEDDVRELRTTK